MYWILYVQFVSLILGFWNYSSATQRCVIQNAALCWQTVILDVLFYWKQVVFVTWIIINLHSYLLAYWWIMWSFCFFLFIWPFANAQFVQKVVDGFWMKSCRISVLFFHILGLQQRSSIYSLQLPWEGVSRGQSFRSIIWQWVTLNLAW